MLEIRLATITDLSGITEIYNDAILKTTATFDVAPKTYDEQLAWFNSHDKQLPIFVAVENSLVIGWASLSLWSDRRAYSGTAEVSFYVRENAHGRGVGRQLFSHLVNAAIESGYHSLVSRIADGSAASIYLHTQLGFFNVGVMKEVGLKFGKLLDVHLMQKML